MEMIYCLIAISSRSDKTVNGVGRDNRIQRAKLELRESNGVWMVYDCELRRKVFSDGSIHQFLCSLEFRSELVGFPNGGLNRCLAAFLLADEATFAAAYGKQRRQALGNG